MTVGHRRLLYSFFILLFLIISPVILLYGAGYRYDARRQSIYKTGLLFIQTSPAPDRILFDGITVRSPRKGVRLAGLVPGTHTVRLEKEGYITWTKTVTIQPGQATSLYGLHLLRTPSPQLLLSGVERTTVTADGTRIAYRRNNSSDIRVLDRKTGSDDLLLTSLKTFADFAWSSSGDHLLLSNPTGNQAVLVVDRNGTRTNIFADTTNTTVQARWSGNTSDTIFMLYANKLYDYSLKTRATTLIAENVVDWDDSSSDHLYLLQKTEAGIAVVRADASAAHTLVVIPASTQGRFLPSPNGFLSLLIGDSQKLIVIPTERPEEQKAFPSTTMAVWQPGGQAIAYGNAQELSLWHPGETDGTLLTRSTNSTISFSWIGSSEYILRVHPQGLDAIEVNHGAPPFQTQILPQSIQKLDNSKDAKTAFALTEDGKLYIVNF